ncbi:MAG: hypothetical protein M0D55_18655 [Elusimicrobiota bacterium]|nr:MAG: hypothetical protein M0D55_18655 [Elusimicrobiota bacterium]
MAPLNLVVGSGPSGVAAASALLDAGREVLMVDLGRSAVPGARPEEPEGDPPRKLALGSSHPYMSDAEAGLVQHGTKCLASGGLGGLSAVWGASVLPFPEDELAEWPFPAAELRAHYARTAAMLGISGIVDGLASRFPFHAPPAPALRPSLQAQSLLNKLTENAATLNQHGLTFGRARHAVRAELCEYDAACLGGCGKRAIWSAADAVEALKKRPGFRYQGGVRVLSIEERGGGVRLHVLPAGASRTVVDGARVFVGAGPLATARLLCGSFGAPAGGLPLLAQPYFLFPLLLDRDVPGAPEEKLHTLAQVFLELQDDAVSKRSAHFQLYGHNSLIAEKLRRTLGLAGPFGGALTRHFAPRLLAAQGYLHSDEGIPVHVEAAGRGEDCRLTLTAGSRAATKAAIRRAVAKLSRHSRELGMAPLTPLLKVGQPGEGNHVGGLFPMRSSPGSWQTDRVGRLTGHPNVHLIDSSVLPTLPAPTFTYAIMANASRIATEA